jgi:hypothetical protein
LEPVLGIFAQVLAAFRGRFPYEGGFLPVGGARHIFLLVSGRDLRIYLKG